MVAGERALDAEPAGVYRLHHIAFSGEVFGQQLAQFGVVVDDEHSDLGTR